MRILMVSDQYAPMIGGVPTVTRALATGLAGRGHAVAVLAPSPDRRGSASPATSGTGRDGPGSGQDGPDGPGSGRLGQARVRYLPSAAWPFYDGMRLASPGAARRAMAASRRPDVVHIHCPLTLGATALISARRRRIPVVYTNHYLPVNVRPSARATPAAFDDAFYRLLLGFANRCSYVTAPTATALELLRGRGLRVPSRVISNGVDTARYCPGPPDEQVRARYGLRRDRPVILSVGRLSPEKGLDVLIDAAAALRCPAQVAIAGTGPQEAQLRARAARLGLAGRVTFLGFVPDADLPAVYRLADMFAIASGAELQSLTTLAAMAAGLPVVAAAAGALAELVRHGSTGLLFTPGDAAGLAARADLLAGDAGLRRDLAAAALQVAGTHERRRTLAEWERLYGLLVRTEPPGRQQ